MKKEEILKLFLGIGAQLDLAALEYLYRNQKVLDYFTKNRFEYPTPPTITVEFINRVIGLRGNMEIIKQGRREKEKVSVEDVSLFLNTRYNAIKKLLESRPDLVNLSSINKISISSKKFSIVAVVKEKNDEERSVLVEDNSGEICIVFDNSSLFDELMTDDVAGFVCIQENNKIKAESIVWPDIPFGRSIATTEEEIYCLFVSDILFGHEDFKKESFEKFLNWVGKLQYDNLCIFVLGGISEKEQQITSFFDKLPKNALKIFVKGKMDADANIAEIVLSSPCFLRMGEVTILLSNDDFLSEYRKTWNEKATRTLLRLLRRRVLNPRIGFNDTVYENDPFFIDPIPDIFVAGNVFDAGELNYKTVSILANGSFISEPIFWLVNLKTREIIKHDFT